ncbi:MAG: outer membrane protein assembly factor BamB family protein [Myxococcales bacterium]
MRAAVCVAAALVFACPKMQEAAAPGADGGDQLPPDVRASVLQHHNDAQRSGVYTDAALTREAVRALRRDSAFSASLQGGVYAQPLYWDGGMGGQDLLIVATQRNEVIAFDPLSGARRWSRVLAAPAALSQLPCGNIDPIGIVGTPVIDAGRALLYADAMTDGARHRVYAVSLADGTIQGTPLDLDAAVPGFSSAVQNQRGALALVNGVLYLPYSGHFGDCGNYAGWVVGIDTTGAKAPAAYKTGHGGGIWSMGGVAAMGGSLFVATGNTIGLSAWNGGEAILKLAPGPSFSGAAADYYAPSNWLSLDGSDTDIGTAGALPFDVGTAHYVATLGKDGRLHLADRDNLGGIGGGLASPRVASGVVITAPAVIGTPSGTILAFPASGVSCPAGSGNGFVALRISAGSPPGIATAWCAGVSGRGSPIASTTGGGAESILWQVGAEGDNQLHAFNAETGEALFPGAALGSVTKFNAPIIAKGRVYLAGNTAVYAFTVR